MSAIDYLFDPKRFPKKHRFAVRLANFLAFIQLSLIKLRR